MTRINQTAGLIIALSLTAAGCGGSEKSLDGQWQIDQVADAAGALVQPVPETSPFLLIDGEQISGTTGCNSFSGVADVGEGGSIDFGPLMSTLIGCDDARASQEVNIHAALNSADTWNVDGVSASLSSDGSVVMNLTLADTTLEGSTWSVTAINNGTGGVQSVITGTDPWLSFGAVRALTGSGGCNELSGLYDADGDTLAVERIAATKMLCGSPDGVMGQEIQMSDALSNSSTYSILGDTLNIRDAEGATQITATRTTELP